MLAEAITEWGSYGIAGGALLAIVLWLRGVANKAIDLGVKHVEQLGKTNATQADTTHELALGVKHLGTIAESSQAKLEQIHDDVRKIKETA